MTHRTSSCSAFFFSRLKNQWHSETWDYAPSEKSTFWKESLNISGRGTEHQLTYDGHEGVKVADVEAFPRHINEELDDSGSVFFLHRLGTKRRTLS